MSDFKLEFTLKQHTPIIHFQSDQKGATLRASELKPKLDRFILEQVFGGKENKKDFEKYLIDKDREALDYKVKIHTKNSKKKNIKNKMYFANLGKKPNDAEYRYAMEASSIYVTFMSIHTQLIKAIKENFISLLAMENFGTRQSKGFGSFYLDEKDENYMDIFEALSHANNNYIYAQYPNEDTEKVFSHVEVIYPLIKTGINYPDHPKKPNKHGKEVPNIYGGRGSNASYYRSFLFQYMHDKYNMGNEKKFIKENFFNGHKIDKDNEEKKYVRALLGVGDSVTFRDKRWGKISYNNDEIARYKSPLTFKIFDDYLIIIARNNENIFNKKFEFSDETGTTKEIYTPSEFDINDFINSFADYFNDLILEDINNMFETKIKQAKKTEFKKASK